MGIFEVNLLNLFMAIITLLLFSILTYKVIADNKGISDFHRDKLILESIQTTSPNAPWVSNMEVNFILAQFLKGVRWDGINQEDKEWFIDLINKQIQIPIEWLRDEDISCEEMIRTLQSNTTLEQLEHQHRTTYVHFSLNHIPIFAILMLMIQDTTNIDFTESTDVSSRIDRIRTCSFYHQLRDYVSPFANKNTRNFSQQVLFLQSFEKFRKWSFITWLKVEIDSINEMVKMIENEPLSNDVVGPLVYFSNENLSNFYIKHISSLIMGILPSFILLSILLFDYNDKENEAIILSIIVLLFTIIITVGYTKYSIKETGISDLKIESDRVYSFGFYIGLFLRYLVNIILVTWPYILYLFVSIFSPENKYETFQLGSLSITTLQYYIFFIGFLVIQGTAIIFVIWVFYAHRILGFNTSFWSSYRDLLTAGKLKPLNDDQIEKYTNHLQSIIPKKGFGIFPQEFASTFSFYAILGFVLGYLAIFQ